MTVMDTTPRETELSESPCAGIICEHCKKPGASREEEGIHNTGECRCDDSRKLCWRAWFVDKCDWPLE